MASAVPVAVEETVLVHQLPEQVLVGLECDEDVQVVVDDVRFDGTGVATGSVRRVVVTTASGIEHQLAAKRVTELARGRHQLAAESEDHWAHWLREPRFYTSGLAPEGPALKAPRALAVVDDVIYLEWIIGSQPDPLAAARDLGRWQSEGPFPSLPWLAGPQLAQRLAVSDLDWHGVPFVRTAKVWNRRHEVLEQLRRVPLARSHGDFSLGNLRSSDQTTVAFDWAAAGNDHIGFDLGHLYLSTNTDPSVLLSAYLDGLNHPEMTEAVKFGFHATVALVGASRLHWMHAAQGDVEPAYEPRIGDAYRRLRQLADG